MTSVTAEQPTVPTPAAEPPQHHTDAARRGGRTFARQIGRDTLYLILALPMGILTFTLIVAGWSTALGSLLTFIGVPVAVLTIFGTRGLSWVERRRARIVTGEEIPGRYRRRLPLHGEDWNSLAGIWQWLKDLLLDGQTWRDTLYGLLLLGIGVAGFTIAVTAWSVTLALLSVPAWWWAPGVETDLGFTMLDSWPKALAVFGVGLISIPVTLGLVRGSSALSVAIARGLLGCGRQDLEQRVERLEETRAGAVDAAQAELERIERDLHDGAQARLVAVALDLGLAEQRLTASGDPAGAGELVREARVETQRALAELRDLARGIRPALLAERGLGPAVTSLGARVGGVPTTVDVGPLDDVPSPVETAAYFVVAEALTNIAKHAQRDGRERPRRAPRRPARGRGPRRRRRRCGSVRRRPRRAAQAGRGARRDALRDEPRRRSDAAARGAAVRVVIAEDLALLRDGLRRMLEDNEIEVAAAVEDGDALIEAIERERPDVCVVDVRLPPTFRDEGIRAALEARSRRPGLPVLVLSQYVERVFAKELLADGSGGVGYLLKDRVANVDEFIEAVRRVAGGGTAMDPEVVAQLVAGRGPARLEELTPRERDVLALMAEGRSNAGIARELVVTDGAVEKHVSNIFGKLGLPPSGDDHRRVLAVIAWLEE